MTNNSETLRVHKQFARLLKSGLNGEVVRPSNGKKTSFIQATERLARRWNGRLP